MIYVTLFIIAAITAIYMGWKTDSLALTVAGATLGVADIFLFLLAISSIEFFGWIAFFFFSFFMVVIVVSTQGDESLKNVKGKYNL